MEGPLETSHYSPLYFKTIAKYNRFVSWVLSSRDGSVSLLNIHCRCYYYGTESKLLERVVKYAVLHNVQRLTISIATDVYFTYKSNPFVSLFSCPSLTHLDLYTSPYYGHILELPKSPQLPALKSLSLSCVSFTARDNDCAEHFSNSNLLETLFISECSLHHDAQFLCISNLNLSSLNLESICQYKIVLSTPNLSSLTVMDHPSFSYQEISSTCNLPFLEEVNIDICAYRSYPVIVGWLQVFANVKILTLSSLILKIVLNNLSNLATLRIQPPCLVRLESLKVKMIPHIEISEEEVNRAVKYLLQNSQLTRVDVINC